MKEARHNPPRRGARARRAAETRARAAAAVLLLAAVFLLSPAAARAQSFSKEYPAAPRIRLVLNNRSGTVEVLAWERNKIKVSARMESRSTRVVPQMSGDEMTIDIERENRDDHGDVNFTIQVPAESTVDIRTKSGNIVVRNVRGDAVLARVSTEGDIELTGIRAKVVIAQNIIGNILFDAELLGGGSYDLTSTRGNIQLRIDAKEGFQLTATAPRTRSINLGGFASRGQFEFQGDNRRVIGKVGNGGAILSTTTNERGSIVFISNAR